MGDVDDDQPAFLGENASVVAGQRPASAHEGATVDEHQHRRAITLLATGPDVEVETVLTLIRGVASHYRVETGRILRRDWPCGHHVTHTPPLRRSRRHLETQLADRRLGIRNSPKGGDGVRSRTAQPAKRRVQLDVLQVSHSHLQHYYQASSASRTKPAGLETCNRQPP